VLSCRINHRMHNKLLLVDGSQAVIGGATSVIVTSGWGCRLTSSIWIWSAAAPLSAGRAGVRAVLAQSLEPPGPSPVETPLAASRNPGPERLPADPDRPRHGGRL
jgi:hypothetical protein